jgi:hypothetical protein
VTGERWTNAHKEYHHMRYYMPRDDLAVVVRARARERKIETMWQLLALAGMILAALALLNGVTGVAG